MSCRPVHRRTHPIAGERAPRVRRSGRALVASLGGIASLCAAALCGIASLCVVALAPGPVHADEFIPIEEWRGEDGLTGDDIYDRVVANRFDSSRSLLSMSSRDRADHRQYVELDVKYLRGEPGDEVLSMSLAKYPRPVEVRHMGYLVINKRDGPDDQFVYRPSTRNVRRINARTEAISGTDFTLEDIVPREAEDADSYRMADTEYKGRPAYVVTVVPHEDVRSSYSKFVVTVEKERAVPLLTDYWDDRGVHVKQLRADPRSIEAFSEERDGAPKRIWIVRRSKMMHLKRESQTVLNVLDFTPNPDLSERDFSQRELTAGH
jgi:hypothetical protein